MSCFISGSRQSDELAKVNEGKYIYIYEIYTAPSLIHIGATFFTLAGLDHPLSGFIDRQIVGDGIDQLELGLFWAVVRC